MLVATASLGLITPIAAQASDVINLEGMNDYNRSKKKSSSKRFDSNAFVNEVNEGLATLETPPNNFEASGFSDTTTADFKTVFTVGQADSDDDGFTGKIQAAYTWTMNLNTSFNGDDNLYTRIKTGNHSGYSATKGEQNTYLSAGNSNDDAVEVDKIWYTRPVGDNTTVFIGPKILIQLSNTAFIHSSGVLSFSRRDNLYLIESSKRTT